MLADSNENITDIYEQGFLPTRIKENYYYLARNVRINLQNFELTSENRRILKKTEVLSIENIALKDYAFNYEITKLAAEFFKTKFDEKIISTQKLKWLLSGEFFTNLLIYKIADEEIGYCITMETKDLIHYAYPFYKSELINQNIGMAMMIQAIIHAKENNKKHIYLGTVYTKDSLYKLQFKNMEWFDGENWIDDIDKLKEKIKQNEN